MFDKYCHIIVKQALITRNLMWIAMWESLLFTFVVEHRILL